MTSQLLPPNPCLLAILLIVNYHHQPRLLFHYPPRPGEDNSHFATYLKSDLTDDETTSSDEESSSSANEHSSKKESREKSKSKVALEADVEGAGSASPENIERLVSMQRQPKWDDIFAYGAINLAKLLCPASSAHKKRFEMSLNDKAFIGWPVFSRDGQWQRRRKKKRPRAGDQLSEEKFQSGQTERSNLAAKSTLHLEEELDATSGQDTDIDGRHTSRGEAETLLGQKVANPQSDQIREEAFKPKKAKEELASKDTLKMFHVVFVLDPPPLEYHIRTKEMYDHVIKKFSRALKWEQARSNYVSKEASAISSASKGHYKASVSETLASMYQQILLQSSLAKAISTLFNSISNSKIAHIHLTPSLSLSLQIPIPTSTSILPSPIAPQLPGLWLTTANSLPSGDEINTTTSQLASHFTLLLLSDLSNILSDVNATASPLTGPLTHYLRVYKPTKSFLQTSQTSDIPLPDIQFLASHLIYWRRARAIPPLHQRDAYIVSPNADMQKLVASTSSFAKLFPTLPSLPKILNMLSFTPRPYSALIPSKNHKEAYLEILAWLLRYGWVTQLRTFAWIKVPSHIKDIVAKQPEPTPPQPVSKPDDGPSVSTANLNPPPPNQLSPPSPTSSTNSNRTSFPYPSSPPIPSLIPDPRHASGLPSRHLAAISAYVLEQQGKETSCAWDRCVGYFDGRHAVEIIAVREGWKRKRVDELMAGWERLGILIRGRHW